VRRVATRGVLIALALALAASCSTYRLGDEVAAGARGAGADGADGGQIVDTGNGADVNAIPGAEAGGQGDPARAPATNSTVAAGVRTASDRGVTPDTIKLGIMSTSADAVGDLGQDYKGKTMEEIAQPFVDEVNAQGGINGRKVVPAYTGVNPASADSMLAACVQQAEDHKVFASLALVGFYGEGEVCMATKQTPTLSPSNSAEYTLYDREQGWVRQTSMNKDRALRNWIDWMAQSRTAVPATKIGLIYTDVPEDRYVVEHTVLPYLKQKGLNVAEVAVFTISSIDAMVGEAQRAAFNFKAHGIELVLPVTNFLQMFLFVQQADLTGYVPRYSVSDFGAMSTDAVDFYPASQWEGVTGITSTLAGQPLKDEVPDIPAAQECLSVYNAAGKRFTIVPETGQADPVEVTAMLQACEHVALFADAARRAGINPTRRSFLDAVGNTGKWSHRVVLSPPLTFTPKKYDSLDAYAVVRWQANCHGSDGCYRRIEGFRQGQ
jgi:ABC-type branched-subunit amino acid transport system substrate-binding protein